MDLRSVQHVESHGVISGNWYHVTSFPTDEGISAYWQDITECKRIKGAQLVKIAIQDDLTGFYNRYFFDAIFRDHMEIADRYDQPLSMALLRPDQFNEQVAKHGRPTNEEIIQMVANAMRGVIRDSDQVVRFGDEDFGILMPHTDQFGAAEAAEKIREAVEHIEHPLAGRPTVSLGVAERMKIESFRHWYRRLDETLYNAHLSGPDRVAIWDRFDHLQIGAVKIGWRKEWESGNHEIDRQHQEMVDLGNRLVQTGSLHQDCKDLQPAFEALHVKVAAHFQYEDDILVTVGYPGHSSRVERHKRLLAKSEWGRQACCCEEISIDAFISFLLDDLVLEHLMDTDEVFHYARNRI